MRVLIADDNRDSADTLAMLCDAWGYESTVVFDGDSALAMLRQPDAPKLCLLDWEMPGATGIDICAALRKEREIPYRYLILITGRAERANMVNGLNAGADDFLFKPVDADELRARLITGTRVLNLQDQLLRTMKQLKTQASRDALTDVWNRAAIFEILQREMARLDRSSQSMSIALADVDFFKHINDTGGHLMGDNVLIEVAARLKRGVRTYDSVGRYGGEEFLIVLPGCDTVEARQLGERLRRSIQEEIFVTPQGQRHATISIGLATWNRHSDITDLVRRADQALYIAKKSGRNKVVMDDSTPIARPMPTATVSHSN